MAPLLPRLVLSLAAGATMALGLAPAAVADPPAVPQAGSEPADATIRDLTNLGYRVQLNWVNGSHDALLSECAVDNINTVDGAVAYVDVDCPK